MFKNKPMIYADGTRADNTQKKEFLPHQRWGNKKNVSYLIINALPQPTSSGF